MMLGRISRVDIETNCCPYRALPRPYHACLGSVGLCVEIGSVNIYRGIIISSLTARSGFWAAAGADCLPPEVCRVQGIN